MSLTQKAGVFAVIQELFNHQAGLFQPTKEQRKEIVELVTDNIQNGTIDFSEEAKAKYVSRDDIKGYVAGMVSNWLRKDTRLNGDVIYIAKNPGSRAGQGDEILKNLKALKATLTEKTHIEAVDAEIKVRSDELAAVKASKVTKPVDFSKIPEGLLKTLGLDKQLNVAE